MMRWNWLFAMFPVALFMAWRHMDPILVFVAAALAVIPLVRVMGDATEELASSMGPSIGGLLNTTMGTIPDIIIGVSALRHGLVEVVKASITGAIIGNLLFILGTAILLGGLRTGTGLRYDEKVCHLLRGLLLLATIGLMIPAIFDFSTASEIEISLEVAVVLLVTYLISVYFTLTDRSPGGEAMVALETCLITPEDDQLPLPARGRGGTFVLLLIVTAALAVISEVLADAVQPAANSLGLTPVFTGIFLLAPVGSAIEMINSVRFARKQQLDITLATTLGSSTQAALLVAPVLVFVSLAIGQPMNLLFSSFQVVAIIVSVVAVNNVLNMGTVYWISGTRLIAIYLILGIGFYYAP